MRSKNDLTEYELQTLKSQNSNRDQRYEDMVSQKVMRKLESHVVPSLSFHSVTSGSPMQLRTKCFHFVYLQKLLMPTIRSILHEQLKA